MIYFQRTFDQELVRRIVTHPKVYPWVTEDGAPPAESFIPTMHPSFWYVLAADTARNDEQRRRDSSSDLALAPELLGLWMCEARGAAWEVHTCLLPGYGLYLSHIRKCRQAAKEFVAWVWANTPCRRLFTNVPAFNRAALKFAEDAGMRQFGVNEKAWLKNGELHDLILLGISPCQ